MVGWDAYELFKVGEQGTVLLQRSAPLLNADPKNPHAADSNWARDSFKTFIPLSVENDARSHVIFSFFDLLSAIAAHGKMNGFGGRKVSRMAAWWAFEQRDTGSGFDGGYKAWLRCAGERRSELMIDRVC